MMWGPTKWDAARWGLPSDGAAIPVLTRGKHLGRFTLHGPTDRSYRPEELAQAVALVDQAGAALAALTEPPNERSS